MSKTYVALLRGINVGGKNLIKMSALKSCFVDHGFPDAVTYIASGNVLFTSDEAKAAELTRRIEEMLCGTFSSYRASVVLRTQKQMRDVVELAPRGFGKSPDLYRYDAIFLKEPLTAATAMKSVLIREGVDEVHPGKGVLYSSRLDSRATESRLSRLVSMPVYQSMTIRNWNTTTKLLGLMEEMAAR